MKVESKFNVGDELFHLVKYNYTHVECTFCAGTGVVWGRDHSELDCPEEGCFGGKIEKSTKHFWKVKDIKLHCIKTEVLEKSVRIKYLNKAYQSIFEKDLFFSKLEADKECEKRNNENVKSRT